MRGKNTKTGVVERIEWQSFGVLLTCGVDEAGRGCLAGPVCAAAVILRPDSRIIGLTDSKLLTPERRHELAIEVKQEAVAWAVGWGELDEIESINILQASLLAMKRAIEALVPKPELVLIDGNQKIPGSWRQMTFVKGDLRCSPISAASILAKTTRDEYMSQLDKDFPGYGFSQHKGYGTPEHRKNIQALGPSPIHRRSFAGVKEFLAGP